MSLIATARALDDARFTWRARAALLTAASKKRTSAKPIEVTFAHAILQNPMRADNQLEALCATDSAVLAGVVVDDMNMVNTEGVADTALQAVADANFNWMAKQYTDALAASVPPTDQTVYASPMVAN